jgi:type IV secretory pathway VirB10-like protein
MKSSNNNAGRIFMSTDRLISPDGKEIPISGQVEMASIPGVTGDKHSRWFKRMAPSMINAGIGGSLLYWSMLQEQKNRDAMVAAGGSGSVTSAIDNSATQGALNTNAIIEPMIQDGIGGFQKEVTRAFQRGNIDDQVIIREGTTFDILLLAPLVIKL